jgi:hypothetical protein
MDHIVSIKIVIAKAKYNQDVLIMSDYIRNNYEFMKIKENDLYSIYHHDCMFPLKYIYLENFKLMIIGSLNDDDEGYNHCYDLWHDDSLLENPDEKTFSIYMSMYDSAMTIYVAKIYPN